MNKTISFFLVCSFLSGWIFGATALACDDNGDPIHWKTVPGYDSRWIYVKADENCNCNIMINLNFESSELYPNYGINDFMRWYSGTLDKDDLFSIGDDGCFNITVSFVEHNWSYSSNYLAVSPKTYTTAGVMLSAEILVNLVNYQNYTQDENGEDAISSLIGHEVGHCIGMTHDYTDGGVMVNPYPDYDVLNFSSEEIADTDCIYQDFLKKACQGGQSPAFFGQVECENEGSGALLSIETLLELNVDEVAIKWAPYVLGGGWPADDTYSEVGRFDLEHTDGGNYSFLDSGGDTGDMYLLEAIGPDGLVDNSTYIQCGGGSLSHPTYPPGVVDEMRTYSLSKMHYPQWKAIFSGEDEVNSVTNTNSPNCDFLVIAFDDFVQDITPICDYWQWSGFDVELVSCNGEIHSADQIRNFIAGAHAENPLQAVWLVGSPDPAGLGIDLVPAFSGDAGYDFPYSDLNNDSQIDVPVGRLPAQATREVVFYANKELRYHIETAWGGKKDPAYYSTPLVISVPDQFATGSSSNWNPGQWSVYSMAVECAMNLVDYVGWGNVAFLNTPDLEEWGEGDNASYRHAIRDAIFHELELGRHLVFGLSNHNSSASQLGVVTGRMWQSGVEIPGEPGIRPCETFWIIPECYSNSYSANVRKGEDEPLFLHSSRISIYELFMNRGLLVFGSSGSASHAVTEKVSAMLSRRILDDSLMDHARPIGDIWMEVYNELEGNYITQPPGLKDYCIFGDPMLFVRGVYSETSGVGAGVVQPLAITETPNPFNGRIKFHISGLQAGGGSLRIYDIRGRLVKKLDLPRQPDTAIMTWDAKDDLGRDVASGVYFAVVTNHAREIKKKIVYPKLSDSSRFFLTTAS